MRHLTLKDKREMKVFGYTVRAWYINRKGIPFHKDFRSTVELDRFTEKALKAGAELEAVLAV